MGTRVIALRVQDRRGLSLIEVLVALAVVVVALFAIAATQTSAFTANVQAREIAMVRDIASQTLAEVRSTVIEYAYAASANWDDLLDPSSGSLACDAPTVGDLAAVDASGAGPATIADVPACGGGYTVTGQDGVAYSVRWRLGAAGDVVDVLPGVDSPQLGIVHMLLSVDWDRRGVGRSMSFEDYVGCVDVDADVCPAGPGA